MASDWIDDPRRPAVMVIECTIPPQMTISEWRRTRAEALQASAVTRSWDRLRPGVRR
jgi:hypothetical protein